MKRFLSVFLIYMLLTLAIAIAIGRWVGYTKYKQKRLPILKKELLDKGPASVGLVLGSSHCLYGINSITLGAGFYNMASISQSIYEDYVILKTVANTRKVQNVVLSVSYFTNFNFLANNTMQGEKIRVFDYEAAYPIRYTHDMAYYKSKLYLMARCAKMVTVMRVWRPEQDAYGNLAEDCTYAVNNISDSLLSFNRHNSGADFEHTNPYFDSILQFCASHNIKLNLVVMPFSAGYRHAIANSANGPAFEQYIERLKSLQTQKVKLIDCRSFISGNDAVYFRDADHLSACGRELFSEYLAGIIVR